MVTLKQWSCKLPRLPDALLSKWLHRGRVYPEDCFVCANRCCVLSRWPAQCVVSYWLPMSFLIQGNVGVWPDLYSTWHAKGRFRTSRPCELSETAYDASERKLKKCCNPPTPLCPNTLMMVKNRNTHLSNTQLRAWLYEGLIPSQMSTLLSPLESEVWDCSEISCWSPPALQEGALPVYHFPILCILSFPLFSNQ